MDRRVLFGALAGALMFGKEAAAAPFAAQQDLAAAGAAETTEARVKVLGGRRRVATGRVGRVKVFSGRRLRF